MSDYKRYERGSIRSASISKFIRRTTCKRSFCPAKKSTNEDIHHAASLLTDSHVSLELGVLLDTAVFVNPVEDLFVPHQPVLVLEDPLEEILVSR